MSGGYLTMWRDHANPILRAVSAAGDAFHNTSEWGDDYYGPPTQIEKIEAAAREQYERLAKLYAVVEAARLLLCELSDWTLEEAREGIGNTNVSVLRQRRDETAAALARLDDPQTGDR